MHSVVVGLRCLGLLFGVVSLVGCVAVDSAPDGEDGGCLDDLSCPPGFECAINLIDPSALGECVPITMMQNCTTDEDCFRGESCVQGACVMGNNQDPDPTPDNTPDPTPDDEPDPTPDNTPDPQPDDFDNCGNNGDCEVFEECCDGICIERGTCETNGGTCTAQGQPCNLGEEENLVDEGTFFCGRLTDGGEGVCMSKCTTAVSPDVCASGSYCWDVGSDVMPVTLCLPSQCDNSAQCIGSGADGTDGTCIRFDNETGLCFGAGTAAQGATCNIDSQAPADNCGVDLFCITAENSRIGTCRALCDMYAPTNACSPGTACGLLTLETGVCDDTTATGRQPFDTCSPVLDWCGDGLRCFETGTPPDTQNLCLAYCRPDQNFDCNGIAFQGIPTECATVFVDDDMQPLQDIGLCFPPQ